MRVAIGGLILALAVAGCGTNKLSGLGPDDTWGGDRAGLLIRAKGPSEAGRGTELAVEVQFDVRETRLRPGALKLDRRPPARFARLILTPEAGGTPVIVEPRDPGAGLPESPPENGVWPTWMLASEAPDAVTITFPLARVWDAAPLGDYTAAVELDYGSDAHGTWRGKVHSAPFDLALVESPTVATTYAAPTRLRLSGRDVFYGEEDVERLVVQVRPGFSFGLRIRQSDGGGMLHGGAALPEVPRQVGRLADGLARGAEFRYWMELFESADPPQHLDAQRGGGYRVLWKREFKVRAP